MTEEACEPLGKTSLSSDSLISDILFEVVALDEAFIEKGHVGFAGELNFVPVVGVFLEKANHDIVIDFELIIFDDHFGFGLENLYVVILKAWVR